MASSIFLFISFLLFLLHLILALTGDIEDNCRACKLLMSTFLEGLSKTEKLHFGGGNTDWEEKKLGKFKTSETRFVEVMEYTCRSEDKDERFRCHSMAERHEELLEEWFFTLQEDGPSLDKFLCIEKLRLCCETGHFGQNCETCPGFKNSGKACFGRGSCNGDGSRAGNGTCSCYKGYTGKLCSNCDSSYFALSQNDTFVECQECFDGCASGCTSAGPKGCVACRSGYELDLELGCQDINECQQQSDLCSNDNEECINLQGSFECKCVGGFKRSKSGGCEEGVEEKSAEKTNSAEDEEENDVSEEKGENKNIDQNYIRKGEEEAEERTKASNENWDEL